ncbi:MAG TPA: ATP-binding cassette domain-containing protein [Microthrixaceae bacterium]|nr:ATP-binding cassette domain-containing protein [Microthrixaceae bacterium]
MSTPLFAFDDVGLEVDGAVILDAITVELPADGVVVVAGASGSGKSSLLRLCNRLVAPTTGTVRFRGDDVAALDVRRLRRRVGMVFQRPTPFPGTVHENLRVAEPSLDEDGAIALLASVGLPAEFVERDALTLSGGEAQRMCTARTLATRPEAVLMDEPTSALDEDNARGVEELARSLVGAGVSIVWVTHDRAQIDRIADVVIRLDGGRIVSGES